ncbi:MAG TPA: DUF4355 domain-containing protein [Aeromicrobium sp.]|nr:DUF4355 domain-containing protein [Aeromicrobium sp.]
MPEEQAAAGQNESNDDGGNSGFTPPATQDELNKIISDRVARERAKFADYTDLKSKAAKFDELDQASKSEQERLTERLTAAETRAAELEQRSIRLEVASENGLTPAQAKRLVGATREELEADAKELLATFKPASDESSEDVAGSLDLGNRGGAPRKGASTAEQFAAAIDGSFTR